MKILTPPLTPQEIATLKTGDYLYISGILYTARDTAHKRFVSLLQQGQTLPIDLRGQIIFYAGPSPQKPGRVIGSVGPTTSYRMDAYTPTLLAETGLAGMIGKGKRNEAVRAAIAQYNAVYFAATGGAAALLSQCVIDAEVVLYPELGPEAVRKLTVKEFPVVVVNDIYGHDLYEEAIEEWNTEEKD